MNNSWNIKKELFDIFDYARELYNVYYRKDNDYTEEDLEIIKSYITKIEESINEIKEEEI